jgi:predicted ArsR family transcriptional regulator
VRVIVGDIRQNLLTRFLEKDALSVDELSDAAEIMRGAVKQHLTS